MFATEALSRFIQYDLGTVLDIGSGDNEQATAMRDAGIAVTTLSLRPPADIIGDYMTVPFEPFDGIWASHVLEHVPNVGKFLEKCFVDLKDGGILCVTVPPAKHNIVGGHLSLWNEGLLLYRLILAGFDCSQATVGVYGYNISVIVRKVNADLPVLALDCGDIEKLAHFFPMPARQELDGQCGNVNWELMV